MYIGNFNRYIKVQTLVVTKNSFGEETKDWVDFIECYAEKFDKIVTEKFEANQKIGLEISVFTIYFEEGINSTMRIIDIDENKVYEITGVKEIGYKEGIQMYANHKSVYN